MALQTKQVWNATKTNPHKLRLWVGLSFTVALGVHTCAKADILDKYIVAAEKLERAPSEEFWELKVDGLKSPDIFFSKKQESRLGLNFISEYFLSSLSNIYDPANETLRLPLEHSRKTPFFGASVSYRLHSNHSFSLYGFFYNHSGSFIPQNNTTIKQDMFARGIPTEQQLEVFNYRFAYHYLFKQANRLRYSVGLGLDAALLKLNLRQGVQEISDRHLQLLPILCAQADVSLTERLWLQNGVLGSYFSKHQSLISVTTQLAYKLRFIRDDFSEISLGLRFQDSQIKSDYIVAELSHIGALASIRFNFQ